MKSMRQLFRQPLRTLAGILVVALAVSVLSVSASQTLAAANTAEHLNDTFLTVALPTSEITANSLEWIEKVKADHPEIFVADVSHGLASAYIPALTPDNYTQHLYMTNFATQNASYQPNPRVSYSAAMLVVTLESWGQPEDVIYLDTPNGTSIPLTKSAAPSVELVGTVEQVIGLQEGFDDPTGYTARLTLNLTSMEHWVEIEPQLIAGKRYLVYGINYWDADWELRCKMAELMTWRDEPELLDWDMNAYEEWERTDWNWLPDGTGVPVKVKSIKCKIGDLYHGMTDAEAKMFRTVNLTLTDPVTVPEYSNEYVLDENGAPVYDELGYQFLRKLKEPQLTYTDKDGNTITLTEDEYAQRYQPPTFVHLEGSAEEFLASEDGTLWLKVLDDLTVNCNTFPVIGVDNLSYVAGFATGKAEITQGRFLNAEELEMGAKVCVMAQSLAEANGLSIGDTIDPQFYDFDPIDPNQKYISTGMEYNSGLVNPKAYYYRADTTPFVGEAESYTIVGLYEQKAAWGDVDNDFYAFTPNTIFVPKASVPSTMDYSSYGMFRTLVINSNQMYELQLLSVEDNMDDTFYYYDNGYSAVAATLDDFQEAAQQILPVGIVVYAIVMLLFLFLFPGRQGRELAMMDSLGSDVGHRVRHMLASCLGIVIPGTAVGTTVGLLLWRQVSDALQTWVETSISVELSPWSLWVVAAIQVAVVAAATLILAVPMAKKASLMKRK